MYIVNAAATSATVSATTAAVLFSQFALCYSVDASTHLVLLLVFDYYIFLFLQSSCCFVFPNSLGYHIQSFSHCQSFLSHAKSPRIHSFSFSFVSIFYMHLHYVFVPFVLLPRWISVVGLPIATLYPSLTRSTSFQITFNYNEFSWLLNRALHACFICYYILWVCSKCIHNKTGYSCMNHFYWLFLSDISKCQLMIMNKKTIKGKISCCLMSAVKVAISIYCFGCLGDMKCKHLFNCIS